MSRRAWQLERGQNHAAPEIIGVYRRKKKALRAFEAHRKGAQKAAGHKIQRYSYDDGTHVSAWGTNVLTLRPGIPARGRKGRRPRRRGRP
jgi:hypothetical protein